MTPRAGLACARRAPLLRVEHLPCGVVGQMEAARASQAEAGPGSPFFLGGFVLLVAALCLAGLAAPVWAMRRWRGGWRLAAAAPAALLGFVILNIAVGTAIDPTSHNLWPFEILMAGLACLGAIAVLAIMRRVLGAGNE